MEKGIFEYIWRYSKRQQIIITLITVASFPFLYAALELPKTIVNDAISGGDVTRTFFGIAFDQTGYLLTLCAILFALLLINGGFLMLVNTYKNITSERMLRRLRYMLYERILGFPIPHFQKVSQGELSAMIAAETELIREFISDAFALPLFQGGTLITILFFMFAQDVVLGLAAVSLIPLQAYVIPKLQRKINLLGKERVQRARKMSGRVSESASGIRDIRTHNTSLFSLADFSKHLEGIYFVRYKLFRTKFFMKFLNTFMLKLTPLLFYSVGGVLIIQGELTVGALVAVLAAYNNLTTPWKELLKYYQRMGDAQIKYQQLVSSFEPGALFVKSASEAEASSLEKFDGSLKFENVTILDTDGAKALDQVSFEVKSGGRLAIVAGAVGREALAHALARLVPLSEGKIQIGNCNLASLSPATLGARIGYAGADSYVFEGTVGYNGTYSLLNRAPKKTQSQNYNLDEAIASGNCPYDAEQDWTDYSAAKCANQSDLNDWWYEVVKAVELDNFLFQRALSWSLTAENYEDLATKLLEARKEVSRRLDAQPKLSELVYPFDFETYNPNASIAANIVFGEPIDDRFSFSQFGENEFVRNILRDTGLDVIFKRLGFETAQQIVDLFGDPEADSGLLERFSFIDTATLDKLRPIVKEASEQGVDALDKTSEAQVISLVCQLIVERHRINHITEDIQAEIIKARKLFHKRLPEDLRDAIAMFDKDIFNNRLSVRCNLIMGRLTQRRSNAEQEINVMLYNVLTEMNLLKDVILSGNAIDVGIAGQRLPLAARQSLALARSLIKRPDILVVNDALSALDRESRGRIRRNIMDLIPETTLIWIDSETPNISDFDEVVVLRNGRIDKRIVEHREEVITTPEVHEQLDEIPSTIASEAMALKRVPLFKDIRSANLKLLAFGSKRIKFDQGEYIARQGEEGTTAYLILSGKVDILLQEGTGQEAQIAHLGANDLIGETALLATVPRTATARAFTKVEALQIEKDVFLDLIDSDPKLAANVARLASERLASALGKMEKAA